MLNKLLIKLNTAHIKFMESLKLLKTVYTKDTLIKGAVGQLERKYDELTKLIFKKIQEEQKKDDFDRLMIDFNKEGEEN